MFNRLQKEGHVTAGASPLLHVGEKLVAENEILRHEIQGLRKAIKEEKKKRKRGKTMGLLEKGENPSQPLFFSPSRVGRARQRAADEAEAERQRKQAIQDRKLQIARARAERALEKEERKAARVAAREAAEAERARKKAEQAARKAAHQASKLAEATKRHQDVATETEQSIVIKETEGNAGKSKKRRLVEEEPIAPRKVPCAKLPAHRNMQNASSSRIILGSPEPEPYTKVVSKLDTSRSTSVQQGAGGTLVSQRSRSGRSIKLPTRFQSCI
jgi:hypothetical protein